MVRENRVGAKRGEDSLVVSLHCQIHLTAAVDSFAKNMLPKLYLYLSLKNRLGFVDIYGYACELPDSSERECGGHPYLPTPTKKLSEGSRTKHSTAFLCCPYLDLIHSQSGMQGVPDLIVNSFCW